MGMLLRIGSQMLQVDDVLLPLRLVQAELAAQLGAQRRRGVAHVAHVGHRVAGRGAEDEEVQRDGDEDRHQREQRPLDDVVDTTHLNAPAGSLS
jgi:hypothetical protein